MRRYLGHNLDEVQVYKTVTLSSGFSMRGVPEAVTWTLGNMGFSPDPMPLGLRVRGFKWDLGTLQFTLSPSRFFEWELGAFIHAFPLHVCQAEAAADARLAIDHVKAELEGVPVAYAANAPLYYASVHFHVDSCGYKWGAETPQRLVNRTRFKITLPDALTPDAGVKIGNFFERYDKTSQILAKPTAAYIRQDWATNGYTEADGEVGRTEYRLDRARLCRWRLPFTELFPRCLDEVRLVRKPKARKGERYPDRADWPDDSLWAMYRGLTFADPFGDASMCPPGREVVRPPLIRRDTRRLLHAAGRLVALHDMDGDGLGAAQMLVDDLLTMPDADVEIDGAAARMRRVLGPRKPGDPGGVPLEADSAA